MGSAGNVTKSKEIFLTKMARGSGGTERSTSWLCLLGQLLAVAFITSLSFPSSGQELVYSQGLSQEISFKMDLSGGSVGKESASNAGDTGDPGSFPGSGRSPGEGNSIPLQYSCLESSMDRGIWPSAVHGITRSWTQLRDWQFYFYFILFYTLFWVPSPIIHFNLYISVT